ncbi:MAG TPA: FG-GAP repeat protein [Polyangiales bacterium]|nr:FG-GAP repeat protein [Polyangiales bacterium]
MLWLRQRLPWASAFVCACTPIEPVAKNADWSAQASETGESSTRDAAAGDAIRTDSRDATCNEPDARSCEVGNPSRQPLRCKDGAWRAQARCAEDEHCEPTVGSAQGTCVKITPECLGRVPGKAFCDSDDVLTCTNGSSMLVESCGPMRRCVDKAGQSKCECAHGTVELNGRCEVATTCDVARGGCDPLTECTTNGAATRVCSACPPGYAGIDGSYGCTPLLLDLSVEPNTLTPVFSPDKLAYRVQLPLLSPVLTVQPSAADGVTIDINGAPVGETKRWSSEPITFGEHTFPLTLTAQSGLSSRYELTVARVGQQEASLQPKRVDTNDCFGLAVAMSGDTLVAGATGEDSAAIGVNGDDSSNTIQEAGAAYVFVRSGTQWTQQAYLKAQQPQVGDYFGFTVAVDGDTVLVGAAKAGDHSTDSRRPATLELPSLLFVFERQPNGTEWTQRAILTSGTNTPDWFGFGLAFSPDYVFVGAPHDSEHGQNSGAVYAIKRDGTWSSMTKLTASEPAAGAAFGLSVAADKNRLIVGAPEATLSGQGPGKAFTFTRAGDTWQPEAKLVAATPSAAAGFGWSVALQGDVAAVGAPYPTYPHGQTTGNGPHGEVSVFRRSAGAWNLTNTLQATVPRDGDYYGISVGLSGKTLIVGASGDRSSGTGIDPDPHSGDVEDSGAFYLYGEHNTEWTFGNFVKASTAKRGAMFADRVAISGSTIAVSAMYDSGAETTKSGRVYVFR